MFQNNKSLLDTHKILPRSCRPEGELRHRITWDAIYAKFSFLSRKSSLPLLQFPPLFPFSGSPLALLVCWQWIEMIVSFVSNKSINNNNNNNNNLDIGLQIACMCTLWARKYMHIRMVLSAQ